MHTPRVKWCCFEYVMRRFGSYGRLEQSSCSSQLRHGCNRVAAGLDFYNAIFISQ